MADIRKTGLIDDFNRPDETPTILPPWYMVPTSLQQGGNVAILSGILRSTTFPTANATAFYGLKVFGSASGDWEIWGMHSGNAALADYSRIGMTTYATNATTSPDGYQVIFGQSIGGTGWEIRRYTGGSFTSVGTSYTSSIPGGDLVLFRKEGGYFSVWRDSSGGAGTSWSLVADYTDGSPFAGPYVAHLGGTGVETGWNWFGGGSRLRSQIYRYVSN